MKKVLIILVILLVVSCQSKKEDVAPISSPVITPVEIKSEVTIPSIKEEVSQSDGAVNDFFTKLSKVESYSYRFEGKKIYVDYKNNIILVEYDSAYLSDNGM